MRFTGVSLVMRNFANSKRSAGASVSTFFLRSVSRSNSVMTECRSKSRALHVCTLGIP